MENEMDYESKIMELIINGGDARGKALAAIDAALEGDIAKAEETMKECTEALNAAHVQQTDLIQAELNGKGVGVTLLMVHAQDHLMDAMTVKDLAEKFIALSKKMVAEKQS